MAPPNKQTPKAPWWANLLLLLIPVAFFALLEGGLRLAGYGASYPLFVEVPGQPDYLYQNREVARRYFSRTASVPNSLNDFFRREKDADTFRIFVQGGSSAAGYPFYNGGSFSRMLEQRLLQTFPGRNVEVVNTAMAAVNSYTLLDFADEIIAQQPDAVLIYAGHNEYYGALGVGATESMGRSRALVNLYLRLHDVRTVQLLRDLLGKAVGSFAAREAGERPDATLMARMVGEQSIPFGSKTYQQGLDQFRGNLSDLLAKYEAAGIPVFIGTLASNERDHAPFGSGLAEGTDTTAWRRAYDAALGTAAAGDTLAALGQIDALLTRDTLSADAPYARARLLDGLGRYAEARAAYVAAKDRDLLRFRAPEAMNAIIRQEAARHGATVVETQARLAADAPHGLIGHTLMLEHLHPNIEGYFLISDAFYGALHDAALIGAWTAPIPTAEARRERIVTPIDSLLGHYRVQRLMNTWPFQPPGITLPDTFRATTPEQALALEVLYGEKTWGEAMSDLEQHYAERGDYLAALRAALSVIQEYPFAAGPYVDAANLYLRRGQLDEALAYYEAAEERESSALTQRMIGSILLQRGQAAESIPWLERAVEARPEDRGALHNLSGAYAMTGRVEEARATAQRLLKLHPDDQEMRRLLAQLPARSGS